MVFPIREPTQEEILGPREPEAEVEEDELED